MEIVAVIILLLKLALCQSPSQEVTPLTPDVKWKSFPSDSSAIDTYADHNYVVDVTLYNGSSAAESPSGDSL